MSTVANIAKLKSIVHDVIIEASKFENPMRIATAIHGMHGIGKTEIVGQIARENGYNFMPLYLSTQDVPDLIGLPKIKTVCKYKGKRISQKQYIEIENELTENEDWEALDNDLVESEKTFFAKPDWLEDALNDSRPCVYFLDEMNRAEPMVLQTMLPFVLEGRIHTHKIRPQDIVISAMNPDCAEYNVESIEDRALLSRFLHIYLEPETSEWLEFARNNEVHPAVTSVVTANDSALGKVIVPHDVQRIEVTPDPRTNTKVGQLLSNLSDATIKKVGLNVIEGMMGKDIGIQVFNAWNSGDWVSIKNVLDGSFWKSFKFDFARDLDVINNITMEISEYLATGKDKIWEISKESGTPVKWIGKKKELTNITKFIMSLEKDCLYGWIRDYKNKSGEVIAAEGHKADDVSREIAKLINPDIISIATQRKKEYQDKSESTK